MGTDAENVDQFKETEKIVFLCNFSIVVFATYLNIIPAANAPSDISIGSKVAHCSLGYHGFFPSLSSLLNKALCS